MVGGSIYIKISIFNSAKRELNEGYIMPYYDNSGIFRLSLYIPDATLYSLHPSPYILFVGWLLLDYLLKIFDNFVPCLGIFGLHFQ